MKAIKTTAIAALLSCSLLTPVTPALAAPQPTQAEMEAVCALYDLGPEYVVTVDGIRTQDGTATPTGALEDFNFRVDINGPFVLSGATTSGVLSRIGGSPNLFAQLAFSTKTFSNTLVDIRQQNSQTPTYYYNCHIVQTVEIAGGGERDPVLHGPGTNNEGCGRGNYGPNPLTARPGCPARTEVTESDQPQVVPGDPILIADSFTTVQTNVSKAGHLGGLADALFVVSGAFEPFGAFSVACISPSGSVKGNPGSWRTKETYTGSGICSTATFNVAPYAAGNEFPAADLPSNSLPAS